MQFDFVPAGADPILALFLGLCVVVLITLLELQKRDTKDAERDRRITTLETDLARYMGIVVSEPGLFLPADLPEEQEVKKKK